MRVVLVTLGLTLSAGATAQGWVDPRVKPVLVRDIRAAGYSCPEIKHIDYDFDRPGQFGVYRIYCGRVGTFAIDPAMTYLFYKSGSRFVVRAARYAATGGEPRQ